MQLKPRGEMEWQANHAMGQTVAANPRAKCEGRLTSCSDVHADKCMEYQAEASRMGMIRDITDGAVKGDQDDSEE